MLKQIMVFNSVVVIILLQLLNKVNGYQYKSYQNKIIKNYNHQNHFVSSSSSRSKLMSSPPYKGPDSTPILDTINTPSDMKKLSLKQLKQLSHELRWDTINSVSQVGGHLGSSLGVIELTVALHYVFDAPEDKIIWDVAHQAYPHKILTGNDDNDDDNDDGDSDDDDNDSDHDIDYSNDENICDCDDETDVDDNRSIDIYDYKSNFNDDDDDDAFFLFRA